MFLATALTLLAFDHCVEFKGTGLVLNMEYTHQMVVMCKIGGEHIALDTLRSEREGVHTAVVDHFLSDEARNTYTVDDGTVIQPSYGYCVKQLGGLNDRAHDMDNNAWGLCTLNDGSLMSDWTLYRGKKNARTTELRDVLLSLRGN